MGCQLVVKRLNPQPVARYKEVLTAGVPDGEGKHALEMLHAVRPVFFVKMNDRFRVALSAVLMTERSQLLAQDGMVVDFTIENDPDSTVFVAKGLVSGREIHDAEAPHADPDGTSSVDSLVVRSAMDHGSAHLPENSGLNPRAPELHDPRDATHLLMLPAFRPTLACHTSSNHDF